MQGIRKMPTPPPAECATPRRSSSEETQLFVLLGFLMRNRVSIIVGGTGCGKSTQVPQFIIQEAFHAPKELTKGDFELGLLRGNC
eukprot:s736_g9.t1